MREAFRESLNHPEQEAADVREFWRKVEALDEFRNAGTILIYMALPDEVPTQDFIERWLPRKRFVIPRVAGTELELREYDQAALTNGYQNIPEPTDNAAEASPEEIDLALIPGTAFDRKGNRLGRGKGFYDRLLPQLHCPTLAVCQKWRIVDEVPTDPWDIKIDIIL